jgi:WhiB family redox-sensing transcriptional regulator
MSAWEALPSLRCGDYQATAEDWLDLAEPPAWFADASCREHPELSWFVEKGPGAIAAKAVCSGCLVRSECQNHARQDNRLEGIWGGLTSKERRPKLFEGAVPAC